MIAAIWVAATLEASSEVVVVAASPVSGAEINRDLAPARTVVLSAEDLSIGGPPNLTTALNVDVGGVTLESASGNPYQPSLLYHGFQASPLQGVSQGLAVYANGVRINQSFGDTVNWELIPSLAIDHLSIEGSNPVFGLNALGGAINVTLKNGFTAPGHEVDLEGGSFGQARADVQLGAQAGRTALYVAATALHEDGWRDLQSSAIQTFYGDFGWRGVRGEVHLNLTLANSILNGPGTSPVELLAVDPKAQFTAPNRISDRYGKVGADGRLQLAAKTDLEGVISYDHFRQQVANGNAANDTPCADGSDLLCSDAGVSTTTGGAVIPAFLGRQATAYSELDEQFITTDGYGACAQIVNTDDLLGQQNHLTAGASFDGGHTAFSALSHIGGITPISRAFVGPGVVIDEPGTDSPATLGVQDDALGLFASDTLILTPGFSITASVRYNHAKIGLIDHGGDDLDGNHHYSRLNPALGAAFRATPWLTLYSRYAEANRAPTPAELSCASPQDSCSLANFFVADPDLKQVVAHTVEAGVRGQLDPIVGLVGIYQVGLYRTELDDDIIFINSETLGRAFFANVGQTRRQGLDANFQLRADRWRLHFDYSYTDAAYQTGFVESAGDNPAADDDGDLSIRRGSRMPGVPAHQFKLGLRLRANRRLTLDVDATAQTGVYLFGDEANLTPKLPGYGVVDLGAAYRLSAHIELFGRVENVGDATYYTYGAFAPTRAVAISQAPGASNPRSYSPGAPLSGLAGVRMRF